MLIQNHMLFLWCCYLLFLKVLCHTFERMITSGESCLFPSKSRLHDFFVELRPLNLQTIPREQFGRLEG